MVRLSDPIPHKNVVEISLEQNRLENFCISIFAKFITDCRENDFVYLEKKKVGEKFLFFVWLENKVVQS